MSVTLPSDRANAVHRDRSSAARRPLRGALALANRDDKLIVLPDVEEVLRLGRLLVEAGEVADGGADAVLVDAAEEIEGLLVGELLLLVEGQELEHGVGDAARGDLDDLAAEGGAVFSVDAAAEVELVLGG